MITSPFPVYWAGGSFQRLPMTDATHDPSGSYSVQYGNCLQGGQGVCVAPLRIVTSPDNSFVPGGAARSGTTVVRGVPALVANAGRTIVIATREQPGSGRRRRPDGRADQRARLTAGAAGRPPA
jgi:hypothetical protein